MKMQNEKVWLKPIIHIVLFIRRLKATAINARQLRCVA